MKIVAAFVVLSVLPLTGCMTTTTAQGQQVRVTTDPTAVKGCTFIAEVTGKTPGIPIGSYANDEKNADTAIRNNAGALGANVVLLASTTGDNVIVKRGEAYRCESQPAPPK